MTEALKRLWRIVSPHHRRIARKRRLEALLLETGMANRKQATRIANLVFSKRSFI
jgi:hypothetical protein